MAKSQVSIAQHYHERTKYEAQTLAAKVPQVDWDNQPIPFKEYKFGKIFDLNPYWERRIAPEEEETTTWCRLSHLLFCTYGLTSQLTTRRGESISLRATPSAGGLYPAEVYLISRGIPALPAGIYHYQPRTHTLQLFWQDEVWPALQSACFWHPALDHTQLAIAVTAVFFRSAWRYQDRAYRRIFLDTGHLLGNVELACAINDYRPHLIGGFADVTMNKMLYLDPEQEGTVAVVALADVLKIQQNLPLAPVALPSGSQTQYPVIPEGQLLSYLHEATQIHKTKPSDSLQDILKPANTSTSEATTEDKYNFPFCLKVAMALPPIQWGDGLMELEKTIIKRRSTRAYTGLKLTLDELKLILDFTYQPHHYIEQGLDRTPDYCDLSLIQTFIAISGVDGLEEGCYYYAPKAEELRQIRFKNFRPELHRLCLGQNLGRDAAAVLFHTADLSHAIAHYGDRAYRYLHMDAGHLGQRLNLAAIHLGLGVSGIGGFFDDEVNEVLGIPQDEAVLYITTLGRPAT
jgi:SagB-type dehydrogenase family enzyme